MNARLLSDVPQRLHSDFGERTINELILMFRDKQINLEPGFQRRSVWGLSDRRRLIQSIISNYPIPSIFLYKRDHNGKLIYDVIDGKQRLETIFMFTRQKWFKRFSFEARLDLDEEEGLDWHSWRDICRYYKKFRHEFTSYKIQTIEVTGNLSEIIDLFVRINSTGKPLTSGEKRHARFYDSRFLKEAESLTKRHQKYLLDNGILSQSQLDRMKGTELISELLMSIHMGGIINKKTSLDRAIGNDSVNANTLGRICREFVGTLTTLKKVFPKIKETRFRKITDFYSLFMLFWEMRQEGFVLTNKKRNNIAVRLLRALSTNVDELRERLQRVQSIPKRTPQFISNYLLTVQGNTDSAPNRQQRRDILKGLLFSLFDYKDDRRTFSAEQRRIIWNNEDKKICGRCKRTLMWDDFTVDHIISWIRGGRTLLNNAQLLCRECNSRKGAR